MLYLHIQNNKTKKHSYIEKPAHLQTFPGEGKEIYNLCRDWIYQTYNYDYGFFGCYNDEESVKETVERRNLELSN